MLENRLMAGLELDLTTYSLGYLRQPTIKELIELPYDDSEIVSPFIWIEQYYQEVIEKSPSCGLSRLDILLILQDLSIDMIKKEKEEDKKKIHQDPFIIKKVRYNFMDKFFNMLFLIYDCSENDIIIENDNDEGFIIVLKDKAIINKENFDIFIKVILKMFNIEPKDIVVTEDKWKTQTNSEKEKYYINKFKKKEFERQKKNKLHLCDYINYIVNRDKRNYKDLLDWTFYQLITTFRTGTLIKRSNTDERIYMTGMSTLKAEDITDWQSKTKISIDDSIY